MTTYKLYRAGLSETPNAAMTVGSSPEISFLFDPSNSDYQAFKTNVLAGAELQDAEGVVMTQANAFIASLP